MRPAMRRYRIAVISRNGRSLSSGLSGEAGGQMGPHGDALRYSVRRKFRM